MNDRHIDWPGLVRAGLHGLGLHPDAFWRLTPVELRVMLGADLMPPRLTRTRLEELATAFPDTMSDTKPNILSDRKKEHRDGNRRHAGAVAGAGEHTGKLGPDGGQL